MVEDEVLERNADSMASISWSCCGVIGSPQSHSGREKTDGDEGERRSPASIRKVEQRRASLQSGEVWRSTMALVWWLRDYCFVTEKRSNLKYWVKIY